MSPNEFQLRSALRDGEGEHVNPDTIIARARGAQQARHDRRVRYGSVAAAVAVVCGIGVVGSVILTGGGDGQNSSANDAGGGTNADESKNQAAGGARATSSTQPIAPGPMADAAAVPCPASPPKLVLPGGGGTGQFGSQGPLFSVPVEFVKVCAYSGTEGVAASTVLVGDSASEVTKGLESAPKALAASIKCPGGPAATDRGSLVIIGVDKDGTPLKPVVVTLNCPSRVTNGTALRFNWVPPASITQLINAGIRNDPANGPISLPPPGKVTGSPIRS